MSRVCGMNVWGHVMTEKQRSCWMCEFERSCWHHYMASHIQQVLVVIRIWLVGIRWCDNSTHHHLNHDSNESSHEFNTASYESQM